MKKFDNYLTEQLQDEDLAIEYLKSAIEEDDPNVFILMLKDLIEAKRFKKTQLSKETGIARSALYKLLSQKSSPEFSTIKKLLNVLGYRITLERVG